MPKGSSLFGPTNKREQFYVMIAMTTITSRRRATMMTANSEHPVSMKLMLLVAASWTIHCGAALVFLPPPPARWRGMLSRAARGRPPQGRLYHADLSNSWDSFASSSSSSSSSMATGGGTDSLEVLEFKIHADGRVEETVRGIKGGQCHKVTDSINAALGEVTATEPTQEMYEQPVQQGQTLYNNDSWDGSSSW